jgi:tetratricopeptide (TPR) repeat protein
MIRTLNELVHLVSKGCDRPEEHLHFLCKGKPEVMQLYRALRDHDFRTDAAAAKGAGIGELTSYKKYGKILGQHLRQLVFFADLPNSEYTRRRNDGFRATATMKLADHSSCKVVAHDIALDLLENGQKHDRPEWVMQATRSIIDAIATGLMDQKDFNRYVALYREYKEHTDWEHKAKLYLELVHFQLIRKKGYRESLIREIDGYLEELTPMLGKVPSMLFVLHYHLLADHKYLFTGQYEQALVNLDAGIAYFHSRPYDPSSIILLFFYRKMLCLKQLSRFEEGEAVMQEALGVVPEGSINWFTLHQFYIYLCMAAGWHDQALSAYQQATAHKRFAGLREVQHEIWRIIGAYTYIAHRLTKRELPPDALPHFRAARFLNETPTYSQDKNGLNVALLTAHALLQLLEGRFDDLYDRVSALEKYRERYLADGSAPRSEHFIKILGVMAHADFRHSQFAPKTEPLLLQLREMAHDPLSQPFEMEVIPYERLYELLLDFLPPPPQQQSKKGLSF